MFCIRTWAAAAALALAASVAGAQTNSSTDLQVEADIQSEALEWFQPDMNLQELALVEFQGRCVLGLRSPDCKLPIHPIPREVAQRVLELQQEGKLVYFGRGPKAFEAWLVDKNTKADEAQARAMLSTASKKK